MQLKIVIWYYQWGGLDCRVILCYLDWGRRRGGNTGLYLRGIFQTTQGSLA